MSLWAKLKGLGLATLLGVFVCGIFLLIFSFFVSKIAMPGAAVSILAGASLALGSLSGGFFMGYIMGHGGIKYGAVTGGAIFAVLLILSLIFSGSFGFSVLIKLALCLIFGAAGGILGVNRN